MTTRRAAQPAKSAAKPHHRSAIAIGADHAGFSAKERLKQFLSKKKFAVADCGAHSFKKTDDYPDIARSVADAVIKKNVRFGILLCGSGQGMCIAANKKAGIRAVVAWNTASAKTARQDDDANVLCLPARLLHIRSLERITATWLETSFSGRARHTRRIKKIEKLENQKR